MVRRVLVWVGSQLAANTLLLWNALHLANAPCPSSDRHTIHGHEAYLGEEKIEWSFIRAEKSESRKGGKRREKVEKLDLVMKLAFWQTCQNAIKCHEMISVHPMLNM